MGVKLNIWKQRGLTIFGKVLIAKSQGMSNLVYTLSCVECPEKFDKQAQLIINNFIWPKGTNKIKHRTMIGDYDRLGIRSPDVTCMKKALRLAWLARLYEKNHRNFLACSYYDRYGGLKLILRSHFNVDKMYLPLFHKELLQYFQECFDTSKFSGVLWNNKAFEIANQSLYFKEWHEKGILYVRDLLSENQSILSIDDLKQKYNLETVDVMKYNAVRKLTRKWLATPSNLQFLTQTYTVNLDCTIFKYETFLVNIKKAKSREYYNLLISKACEAPTCLLFWEKRGLQNPERVIDSLIIHRKVTKETDLLTLQYKLIHNIIATNKRRTDWKVTNQSKCSYCPETDTLIHS